MRRSEEPRGYDTAQVCLNGHKVTASYLDFPEHRQNFCDQCGAATITACQSCHAEIRGFYRGSMIVQYAPPHFCHECGKAYPWTEAKQQAALDLIEELDGLSADERAALRETLPDLVHETPRSELAALRFKKLLGKISKAAGDVLRKVVIDLAAEAIKKSL